ncbi:hypothetical protein, partial [Mesorhizobium sp. B2-5-4]|uniref:hypothetical protein n=1 Tax=Mesorhizobium sp. B2-5-4 TaxID=2589926 RepID=UPI0015E48F76
RSQYRIGNLTDRDHSRKVARKHRLRWKYSDFETSFLYFVKEIDLTATLKAAAENSERASLEQQVSAIEEKLLQLRAKRERIFELLTEPGASMAFIRSKLDECERQIADEEQLASDVRMQMSTAQAMPVITASELRSLIEAVQDMSAPDIFDRRAVVANRLRMVITSLRMAVDGTRPKIQRIRDFLESENVDPSERRQLLDHIERTNIEAKRYNRSFTVVLADGISRRIVLNNDDPTDFVAEVTVDASGNPAGSERGMDLQTLFGRASE